MTAAIDVAVIPIEWDTADLVLSVAGLTLVGFFDPNAEAPVGDFLRLGADSDWDRVRVERPDLKIAIMLDPPMLRARLFDHYGYNAILPSLISPFAHVSPMATYGHGLIAQRDARIMPMCKLGTGCTLNIGATLHHECTLGDFVSVAPGARLLGGVSVGDGGYIGAGATVVQNIQIGAHAKVGAGAVVVRDVPDGAVVVGVPADRRLR